MTGYGQGGLHDTSRESRVALWIETTDGGSEGSGRAVTIRIVIIIQESMSYTRYYNLHDTTIRYAVSLGHGIKHLTEVPLSFSVTFIYTL